MGKILIGILLFGAASMFSMIMTSCEKMVSISECDQCPANMVCINGVCECDDELSERLLNDCWAKKKGRFVGVNPSARWNFDEIVLDSSGAFNDSIFTYYAHMFILPNKSVSDDPFSDVWRLTFHDIGKTYDSLSGGNLYGFPRVYNLLSQYTVSGRKYQDSLVIDVVLFDPSDGFTLDTLKRIIFIRHE